jgi:VCBS repeat-containing protein
MKSTDSAIWKPERGLWKQQLGALALVTGLLVGSLGTTALGVDAARPPISSKKFQPFSNGTRIAITDNTTTSSTIAVSGFETEIVDVNVSLNTISHTQPSDVDVLLVGPQGQTALIMSDVASASNAANDSLVLDDQAAILLPKQDDLTSGVFQPTNYDIGTDQDSFAPDPRIPSPLPKNTSLAAFNGTNPNGTWTLFVDDDDDDTQDSSGSFAGGWSLSITTLNGAPHTQPDTYRTQAGQTLSVPAAGVLENDRDPDGEPLTAVLDSQPKQGQLTLQPDGSFTYTPNAGANGTDRFTYFAQDASGLQKPETVSIEVSGAKQIPDKKHKKQTKHKKHRK